jgi:hypothetical protein
VDCVGAQCLDFRGALRLVGVKWLLGCERGCGLTGLVWWLNIGWVICSVAAVSGRGEMVFLCRGGEYGCEWFL